MASSQEEALIAVGVGPLRSGGEEPAVHADVFPCRVDPTLQARPLAEQRLVRDLDRGGPRSRVAIEGEQARATEGVDRLRHRPLVDLDRAELAPVDAAAGVLCALAERDQSQEELPDCTLGG